MMSLRELLRNGDRVRVTEPALDIEICGPLEIRQFERAERPHS